MLMVSFFGSLILTLNQIPGTAVHWHEFHEQSEMKGMLVSKACQ